MHRRLTSILFTVGALAAGALVAPLPASATATSDWADLSTSYRFGVQGRPQGSAVDAQGRTYVLSSFPGSPPQIPDFGRITRFQADGTIDGGYRSGGSSTDIDHTSRGALVLRGEFGWVLSVDSSDGSVWLNRVDPGGQSLPQGRLPLPAGSVGAVSLATRGTDGLLAAVEIAGTTRFYGLDADGVPDPAFGSGGVLVEPGITVSAVASTTSTFTTAGLGVSGRGEVRRYSSAGAPDETFGDAGRLEVAPGLIPRNVTLSGGTAYLAGSREAPDGLPTSAVVIRLTAAGQLDPTFSGDGIAETPAQRRGRQVVVAGGGVLLLDTSATDTAPPLVLDRFTSAGAVDTSFGAGGSLVVDQFRGSQVVGGSAVVRPDGRVVLTLGGREAQAPFGGGATVALLKAAPATTPGAFVPVTPSRLLDTRIGTAEPVPANGSVTLQVGGQGGIPVDAAAVTMNVTVVQPRAAFAVTVHPDGTPTPTASNVNGRAGTTVPNLVTVKLGTGGRVVLRNGSTGTVHLLADVAGYYRAGAVSAAGAFVPVAPSRLLDTRRSGGPVKAGGDVDVQVTGAGGVPTANVASVVVNLTAVSPAAGTAVTAYPTGRPLPRVSNLNVDARATRANLATVRVGDGGRIRLHNGSTGATDLLADVAGYYLGGTPTAGGTYVSLPDPERVLDTRGGDPVGAGGTIYVSTGGLAPGSAPETPVWAGALMMNVTVTRPTAAGLVTAYPSGWPLPRASNLNYVRGETLANQVAGRSAGAGEVALTVQGSGSVHLIADVSGYFLD